MSDRLPTSARRLTGRHFLIDGPGAVAEIAHQDTSRVLGRLRFALRELGWEGEPRVHVHQDSVSVGIRSWPDVLDATVRVLDWATGDDPEEDLGRAKRIAASDENPPLRRLLLAFPGLVFEGEGLVTVGLGVHARSFQPDDLPTPEQLGPVRGVPRIHVTGTNGKTTTTRVTAHLCEAAGLTAGRTSSDAVVIGEETVERGDWTGPGAARRVLRDRRVRVAVLETARGGILRRGLVLDGADVAIVTNVTSEHLGEWGIDDLVTMARAKLVIAEGLRRGGTLIVPAHSDPLAAALPELRARRPDLVVKTFSSSPPVHGERVPDGWADATHLHVGDGSVPLGEIPITFDGTARHNVENVLCATLAALAIGLPGDAVGRGLRTFRPSVADNPGRMNTFRMPSGALVVIDFAHTHDGLRRIVETVKRWPKRRRVLLLGQAGDRTDRDLEDLAAAAVPLDAYRIVVKDVTKRLHGRSLGEVPALMRRVLRQRGVPESVIHETADEPTGVRLAIHGAGKDDVIVLLIHETLASAVAILNEAGAVALDP